MSYQVTKKIRQKCKCALLREIRQSEKATYFMIPNIESFIKFEPGNNSL